MSLCTFWFPGMNLVGKEILNDFSEALKNHGMDNIEVFAMVSFCSLYLYNLKGTQTVIR